MPSGPSAWARGLDHPFHLHGFFFQVVQVNGQPASRLGWRDTVNVPQGATVRLKLRLDGFAGSWMYLRERRERTAALGSAARPEGVRGHRQARFR